MAALINKRTQQRHNTEAVLEKHTADTDRAVHRDRTVNKSGSYQREVMLRKVLITQHRTTKELNCYHIDQINNLHYPIDNLCRKT